MSISHTIIASHSETARLDTHELVRRLSMHLSPLLVVTLAGSKDPKLPYKWAKPDGPTPGPAFQKRLQLAHWAWVAIADADNEDIARAWFVGGNPYLEEDTPSQPSVRTAIGTSTAPFPDFSKIGKTSEQTQSRTI